ncbi:MAG: hypothetical protein AB7J40_01715 [Candidatus Altimarinota bacterium]
MRYGIWIDHAKAMIISVDAEEGRSTHEIHSEVPPHMHGGVAEAEGEHRTIVNQNKHNQARSHEMNAFVKKILHALQNATEVVIYGPGNAKFDLKNAIEEEKSIAHSVKRCETTDKLSEDELMALVRKDFNLA